YFADWLVEDRAWQLWKKRSPKAAAVDEAEVMTQFAKEKAENQGEFEAARAAFQKRKAKSTRLDVNVTTSANPPTSHGNDSSTVTEAKAVSARPCPACPQCRSPTVLVPEFDRWLCGRCNIYA
ncbi:MAG: hypothetical protein ABI678_06375, partial [Kofleriaceae bacterium]